MNPPDLAAYAKAVYMQYLDALRNDYGSAQSVLEAGLRNVTPGPVRQSVAVNLVTLGADAQQVSVALEAVSRQSPDGQGGGVAPSSRPFWKHGFFWAVVGVVTTGVVAAVIVEHGK